MTNERNETIAAVATGTGGAVALIRISGERAVPDRRRAVQKHTRKAPVYAERIYDPLRNDSRRRSRYRRSADLSFPRSALLYGRGHDRNIVPRLRLHSSPRDGIGNPARRSDRATGRVHATGISGRQNGPVASRSRRRRHRIRQPRRTRFGVQTNARRLLGRVRPTQGKTRTPRISTRAGTGLRRRRRGVCRSGTIARNIDRAVDGK